VYDLAAVLDADGIVERPLRELAQGRVFLMSSALLVDRQKTAGLRYSEVRGAIEDVPYQVKLLTRGKVGISGSRILMIYTWHQENFSRQAAFFSEGIRLLRRLMKQGDFDGLSDIDRHDLPVFFAQIGRQGVVRELLSGHRFKAAATYLRELPFQLRERRWKFLLSFPVLACLPIETVRRRWQRDSTTVQR
jgi:hypothetical protein